MKKIFLSIIVLLLTANIFAQEITSSPPKVEMLKHEVGVSIGAIPVLIIYPTYSFSLNVFYFYHFNSKHSLGGSLSIVPVVFGMSGQYRNSGDQIVPWFSAELNYKFSYYHSKTMYLYLTISCGLEVVSFDKEISFPSLAYQFMPLGINIGKRHSGFAEIGFGTQGIVKIGYRYRFNSK